MSISSDPFTISIVMPSFNCGQYLAEAIESVVEQAMDYVEVVVVDGGSTDSTISVLKQFESKLPIRWISEADDGLYDALNKGIALANGEWIGWLNCDDMYTPYTFERVVDVTKRRDINVVCGDAELFETDALGNIEILHYFAHYRGDRFTDSLENLKNAHLNACFFHRRLLCEVGPFETRYKIAGDRDYLLRLMRLAPKSQHLGMVTYRYRSHSGSLTMAAYDNKKKKTISSVPSKVEDELSAVCQANLANDDLPGNAQNWCLGMLKHVTAGQAARLLLDKRFSESMKAARTGLRHTTSTWVFKFVKALIGELRH